MDENLDSNLGSTEVALYGDELDVVHSVDGNVSVKVHENKEVDETIDVQQPLEEELWNLDELLALGQQCFEQCTGDSSLEDLQKSKTLLVNYMSLICDHRNQLDSRHDLHAAVGHFASRVLYILFHLEDYEECIRWFEMGTSREDALKSSLEASGSVQYDVAVSFLSNADIKTDMKRRNYSVFRLCSHLERSFQLQVDDFESVILNMKMSLKMNSPTGARSVTMGRLLLVPGEMFEKLLGTPYSHFTIQQVTHLLDQALASAIDMKDKGWLVEGEAVLKMAVAFASKIEDEEMRDGFLEALQKELRRPGEGLKIDEQNLKQLWKLDQLLALGKECLGRTVEGSLEDLQETNFFLVNYMSLICEHRNQLDSRLDLHAAVGDFATRVLYILFHLEDYKGCIRWFEMGISREDELKSSLEASGSVQYNVAVSFLRSATLTTDDQSIQYLLARGSHHLARSCHLQVKDFDKIQRKMQNQVNLDVATGTIAVTLGRLLLVPGEMFEKLLGTPYSNFTTQQLIHLLDQALASAIDMKDKGWLVEGETVLEMAVTFASKIEDEEMRDGFLEALVKMTNKNIRSSGGGTEFSSTSGTSAEVQQPLEEQLWNLDELLALGQQCFEQCTGDSSLEDLQKSKTLLVNYMSLICDHRNQLDSRHDLHAAVGHFASRVLYILFHLEDYEECIRWFEMGTSREDALKSSLEASGSVQYDVAVSFFKRCVGNADLQRQPQIDEVNHYFMDRGIQCLVKCCQLQVDDFDSLSILKNSVVKLCVGVGVCVTLGNVQLVPRSGIFDKLLATPHAHLTQQQVEDLLSEVLESTVELKNLDWLVEAEAVLKMAVTFASNIEDAEEMKDRFLDGVLLQLSRLYDYREEYGKAAETYDKLLKLSKNPSSFRERRLREYERAEALSLAGDDNQAIDLISQVCFDGNDVGDAQAGVALIPHEGWKLNVRLKFRYSIILDRAGRPNEALQQMEEAIALFSTFDYGGDDEDVNCSLLQLLQYYGLDNKYIESALSLMDLIDPVMWKPECKVDFKEYWLKAKGLICLRLHRQDDAEKCWKDAEGFRPDDGSEDKGNTEIQDNSEDIGNTENQDDSEDNDNAENQDDPCDPLYKKHEYAYCDQCKGKHLRDPKWHFSTFLKLAMCKSKSLEDALEALHAAELVVHRRRGGEPSCLVEVHMLRGSLLFGHDQSSSAVEEYERAAEILLEMNQDNHEISRRLSKCYVIQARVKFESGSLDHGIELMRKAEPVLQKENPGMLYYLEALALRLQDRFEQAVAFGEMAFKELIKMQQSKQAFQTQTAEIAWIKTFEESLLSDVIKFNEMTSYYHLRNLRNALIWGERNRTRLYMRNTEDQPSVVRSTSELFDFHYEHAQELLGDAVLMCGPDTAIISYSYVNKVLFCYLVFEGEDRNIMIHCEPVPVTPLELGKLWVSQSEPTLELLVDEAVNAIKAINPARKSRKKSKEDHIRDSTKIAKNLLSILHSILIKPILVNSRFFDHVAEQLRVRCKNLVISPQGFLSMIPFGALYDTERREYLIQQMTVCVIPSIRFMHRSFQRQAEFGKRWKELEPPFVAGNPAPMGYLGNLKPLKGAALEAKEVASILDGAQLYSGEKMTKAAVLHGLRHSQVVLLSTHGVIDSSYPQGALVLRKSNPLASSSPQATLTPAMNSRRNSHDEEILCPTDILAMQGTIPSGLVALSACRSGLGEFTQAEGVLGLGRAVLQKGAATAVLTLWNVSDRETRALITGMFENLRKGSTVPEALGASMVAQLNEGKLLYQWAPLIAMGSPKLRLPMYASTSFEFISTITPDSME